MKRNASSTKKMVLQSEIFPGGYNQQSYSHDGYSSSGYGHGSGMPMGPTPSFSSSHMMQSGGHGPHNHTSTGFHSSGSNGHMSSGFPHGSNMSHGMPTGGFGSSYHGASSNFGHGMPTGSYGSSYHGATHSPMGTKMESLKHDYNNYNYGHSSMMHSPMHGGHQSAEWKLKSIEDDD
ncbi:hypothetical protein POM88_002863 [Heracleum sosnowskyi]|uniref:Uncharacterized protein n=1 Tax=Heracleum sosnowskyi TaxID=360622 RepID=A0AAD8JHJ3_9APIA|nr:hypothetical protein POM88_002863 [Heracleum sosnowskyi]